LNWESVGGEKVEAAEDAIRGQVVDNKEEKEGEEGEEI
jgi:hypothetical protein